MKNKNTKMTAGALVLLLVIAAVVGGVSLMERREQKKQEALLREEAEKLDNPLWSDDNTVYLNDALYGFDHRIETYLFVGTDLSGNEDGEGDEYAGAMADYLLLMVLDHTANRIGYIQIDRNTVTSVNELDAAGEVIETRDLQICTAHWYGKNPQMSAENTVDAVRELLGELAWIDGYYVINMQNIGALNHAVGGVEITFQEDLTAIDPAMKQGATLTLSDEQAEAFVRARKSVGEGTNVERMSRQQQYMEALLSKVRSNVQGNSRYGVELWNMIRDIAESNMNGNAFSRIANKLIKGENQGILRIEGHSELGEVLGDGVEHEEFYADADSIQSVMQQLFSLVPIETEALNEDLDAVDDEDWELLEESDAEGLVFDEDEDDRYEEEEDLEDEDDEDVEDDEDEDGDI